MWRKSGTKNKLLLQAFGAGARAYRLGLVITCCPYPTAHEYRAAWEKGFFAEARRAGRRNQKVLDQLNQLKPN